MENSIVNRLAYWAGIVDGEGTINISRDKKNRFRVRLTISNTSLELVELAHLEFQVGSICHENQKPGHWKIGHKWEVNYISAYNIIRLIYPFLIIKKKQAELAMLFYERKFNRLPGGGHGIMTTEEIEWRESLKQQMHLLNKKGV